MSDGPFYVGDQPGSDIVYALAAEDDGEGLAELEPFTGAIAELRGPSNELIAILPATLEGAVLTVTWAAPPFARPGIHKILATLTGPSLRKRMKPIQVVVEDEASGWLTLAQARAEWEDARQVDDPVLYKLLAVASEAIEAYAPVTAVYAPVGTWIPHPTLEGYEIQGTGATVPVAGSGPSDAFLTAQIMQARSVWNVTKSDTNGAVGFEGGAVITVRPLDGSVRALIRPKRGIPGIA